MTSPADKVLPKSKQALLCYVCAMTAVSLVVANLCAIKNESVFGISLGGGIVTIVTDYILSDLTVEVFGFKKALAVRRASMLLNVFAVVVLQVAVWAPADPEFAANAEFSAIFTAAPLMVVASMVAYMVGTRVNDRVMQVLHDRDGEASLFKRCIVSTVFGGLADTITFTAIAYGSLYSLGSNIENTLLTYGLKLLIEVVVFNLVTKKAISWAKTLPEA